MMRSYATPPDTRIYAIGDLHGHRMPLANMIDMIAEDARGRHIRNIKVVFVGDYIDRGPDSAGLLDDLITLKNGALPFEFIFLKGNHEHGMLAFIDDPHGVRRDWLRWGGIETLASYGIHFNPANDLDRQCEAVADKIREALPFAHHQFLSELKLYYQCGGYLFVHAGIKPNFPLQEQREKDLWMIREGFLDYTGQHPWRVVHGHTIAPQPEILPNRINVDTGLYKNGVLSCAVLEGEQVDILQVRL